jgi:hypothetical protein
MIKIVHVTVHEVAFHFPSLPIPHLPFFNVTLKAQYRADDFALKSHFHEG